MEIKEVLSRCDHTLLSQNATWDDIKAAIDDGIKYSTASVCIPPYYVKRASGYALGKVKIGTVVGFPNGYMTTKTKLFETEDAINSGADEIDMVVNVGEIKAGHYEAIENEIKIIKAACRDRVLKVIIETCLLTDEEKIKMCEVVSNAGADYIKTSTGFSTGGATPEDIILFKNNVSPRLKIKAAGGISSIADAENFIKLGADRIGTSRIIKILKSEKNISGY